MANAKKLPSGSWRVQARKIINGKSIVKSFTVSPKDFASEPPKQASLKAKAQAEMLARNWIFDIEEDTRHTTVEKAIQNLLETRSNVWSPSTLADYMQMPKHFEILYPMDCMDITSKIIQEMINGWAFDGLSRKTIANRINFLKSALKLAGNDRVFDIRYPKKKKTELLPPEPSEFKRLLAAANDEEKLIIILAGLYTLRRGEIAGLIGENILWDMNAIFVEADVVKTKDKVWVRKEPKTEQSVRKIQLAPEVMALFPKVGPKEPIFKMTPDAMTSRFDRLRAKVCVRCRLHDLRKYAASIRTEVMPSKYVEADGGWRPDSKILKTIYDKPFKESRKEYSKIINDKIIADYGEMFGS